MATRRLPAREDGRVPTEEEVAAAGYDELVAFWLAITDHVDRVHHPGDIAAWSSVQPLRRAAVARLEAIATDEPGVVGLVAAAVARPRSGPHRPGDLAATESAMALAAVRRSRVLADSGGIARRGPFADLSSTPNTNRRNTP